MEALALDRALLVSRPGVPARGACTFTQINELCVMVGPAEENFNMH